MKLPWVSRAMYDVVTEALFARAERAESEAHRERQRADALMEKLIATPEPVVTQTKAPDPLMEAIRARAGSNGQVRRALGSYAKTARLQGIEEDAIYKAITDWPSSDDEGVDG